MSEQQTEQTEVYRVGLGRRIALMFVFTAMLPFFISMPVMTVMRAMHGNIVDASTIGIAGLLFAICLYYLAIQIQAAQRTRIELGEQSAHIVTPDWRGMFPTGPYADKTIAYSDIKAVEARGELFRVMGVVGIPNQTSLLTNDGDRILLGPVNENEADPAIDYNKVATKIAEKANVPISNKGVIDAGTQLGVLFKGSPNWDKDPISEGRIETIRRRGQTARHGLVVAVLALAAIGSVLILIPDVRAFFSGLVGGGQ